ncbi:MAG: 16S rRNA (uracil(1498)-N(3))-methyltransferase [Myxococcaceae bacterium]|nr:16S rRNA (uracil(1498)-N(3))-methyltransferase [Myxococcaceae bacterium]MCI0669837.1 16S rRNA (uracil(1498)-N(3))-methyltransferase [Myxococcaceae bacterium]
MVRLLHPVPAPDAPALTVTGDGFHYLARVLRLREGDTLEVFDGAGSSWPARVETLDAHAATARLSLGPRRTAPPPMSLTLLQGLPKGDKLELVLQKATELGATAVAPVETARSVVRIPPEKAQERVHRWVRIVEEAARQCRRSDVPTVHPPRPLLAAARELPQGTRLLVLDEETHATPLSHAAAGALDAPLALVVGPEGGLTREEVTALVALGAQPVTLGARILRTETAALAALAVLLHLRGELG